MKLKKERSRGRYGVWMCLYLFGIVLILCGCTRKTEDVAGLELLFPETAQASETDALEAVDAVLETDTLSAAEPKSGAESVATGNDVTQVLQSEAATFVSSDTSISPSNVQECYVYVCGAVKEPGVYAMEPGRRVFEAIEAAGGFTEQACTEYVNQATTIADGLQIWIPTREEAKKAGWQYPQGQSAGGDVGNGSGGTSGKAAGTSLVNINTADSGQLCRLSGIGEAKAQAIIAYREAHGNFAKKEDIMKVAGIKQSGYEKIKDQITVGQE